ncbi:GNAT family N-acetyltransferase [Porphyromonas loveana]|uniref:Diamine N-acetyltransferase n=1 Tax=Porphyromonas loveana TaxID=1884669 RepID=A0A2U1FCK2_9PORP|nr:GNAT family N-acetyltransferase [Porphyromonas loveana]PVZ09912.1 diamine N-acetyltransferase [Porphyromonas loveana]
MYPDFFATERVRLRALEPEDLEFLYRCENDAELRESGNTLVPVSRSLLRDYIDKSSAGLMDAGMMRLVICTPEDDRPIGAVDLYEYDPFHKRVSVGLFVVPEYRREGIAADALRLVTRYALEHLRLHQVVAYILKGNEPSRTLFESAGYEHTATLRQWMWHRGDYSDVLLYQLWKK